MAKAQKSNKEVKKQAALSPKEKKAAKAAKKTTGGATPMGTKAS